VSTPHSPGLGLSAAARRRAFILGVTNGALFQMGMSFVDPSTVLPAFVNELTHSEFAVGAVSAVAGVGWLLPQLVVANYVQVMPRKLPVYHVTAAIRIACMFGLIPALYAFGSRPHLLFAVFILLYGAFTFAGGAGGISFIDVVAKTVPPYRIGSFFGQRAMYGGILALIAAAVVRRVLSDGGSGSFPHGYISLFVFAAIAVAAALACFSLVSEPAGRVESRRPPLREFLRRAPQILVDDPDFRRLFIVGLLQGAAGIAGPFYVVFTGVGLGMPRDMLGIYLAAGTFGSIASNFLWAPLSDRYGGKRAMAGACAIGFLAPAVATALSILPLPHRAAGWGFCAVFVLVGSAVTGWGIAVNHYLLELAPETLRPTYVGVLNTFSSVLPLMPLLGGILVQTLSYQVVFAVAAVVSLAGLLRAGRLRDLRAAEDRFGSRAHKPAGSASQEGGSSTPAAGAGQSPAGTDEAPPES
jgi:MFS family permease